MTLYYSEFKVEFKVGLSKLRELLDLLNSYSAERAEYSIGRKYIIIKVAQRQDCGPVHDAIMKTLGKITKESDGRYIDWTWKRRHR